MKAKSLITIIITILLFGWTTPLKKNSDLEVLKLKGRVKSVREASFEAIEKSGVIIMGENKRQKFYENDSYIFFNENGNKIEEILYNQLGNVESRIIYSYDERGNEIESITYNALGVIIKKVANIYDETGNTIECYVYKENDLLSLKFSFKYDEKGRETSNKIEPYNSSLKPWELTYKYDNHGSIIEQCNINPLGTTIGKFDYRYDNRSRVVQRIACNAFNGKGKKNSFKYDRRGNVIEESEYKFDGKLMKRFTYRFDKFGNMIEYSTQDSTEQFIIEESYQYQYDKKKNWVKKFIFEKKIPKFVIERKIEYYSENGRQL